MPRLHYSGYEESLADMIAAEILMPSRELNEVVPSLPKTGKQSSTWSGHTGCRTQRLFGGSSVWKRF